MFRRGNYFRPHDGETGRQATLRMKDKATALRLLHSKNETCQQPILNLHTARTYLTASDPEIGKRAWRTVMNEIVLTKMNATFASLHHPRLAVNRGWSSLVPAGS